MRGLVLIAAAVMAGCGGGANSPKAGSGTAEPAGVRITQFYAQPAIAKGEKASLCYGVENAVKVRLDPPVEKVWPALTRCFPVSPAAATRYTLTAEDAQGRSVSETVEIRVGPPRVKILEVNVSATSISRGQEVVFCYKAENAASVRFGAESAMREGSADKDCLSERPVKTTTYRVRATGGSGDVDSEQVTVTVR